MNVRLGRLVKRSLAVASVAMGLVSTSAHAHTLLNTAPSGRMTFNVSMQANIGNQPLSDAMAQWNQVGIGPGKDQAFFIGQTSGTAGSCGYNQQNEATWSNTNCGLAFGASTLAVTSIWSSWGKVIEVDILFNNAKTWSSYSGPLKYNQNGASINDLNRVALHELGHAAGLDHPDEAGQSVSAIMNSRISDIFALQADDIAGAHAIAWEVTPLYFDVPVCRLAALPSSITAGGTSRLLAFCSPAATSYTWTNTGFSSTTSSGFVSPSVSTTYTVEGHTTAGGGNSASVVVSVTAPVVRPDLEVVNVSGPNNAVLSGQIDVTGIIMNKGSSSTSSIQLDFYLSSDAAINTSDFLIGTCSFPRGISAGQSDSCAGTMNVPFGVGAGTYFLGAIIDDSLFDNEGDRTNNTKLASSGVIVITAAAEAQLPVCTLTASSAAISAGGSSTLMASCSPAATTYSWTNVDFAANVASGVVSPAVTTIYSVVGINAAGVSSTASVTVTVAPGVAKNYADLWWAGSVENGWGLSINQHGNALFSVLYVYDSIGKPVWYVISTGTWDSAFSTYTGLVHQPTSAPLNAYTPTSFEPGSAIGSVTITFTSNSTAILRYTINGVTAQKTVQRQIFGYGVAPLAVGDMWWGGTTQDGWGISITQQSAILFGAWFTYGSDGRVTWYVLPNGTWYGNTYSGPFYTTTGSAWLGATYDASKLTVTEIGTMSLSFNGSNNAVMTYTFTSGIFAGTTQSKQIVRQPYTVGQSNSPGPGQLKIFIP